MVDDVHKIELLAQVLTLDNEPPQLSDRDIVSAKVEARAITEPAEYH